MSGSAPPRPGAALTLRAPSGGACEVGTAVVLAPMAGITNAAYRRLCREQAELGAGDRRPAGLFVCEMITSRGLVERDPKSLAMLAFDPGSSVHSVQLYGVDPHYLARAAELLCDEFGVHHIDLNFGCPVPKVTRKGGGGVLPWKRKLLRAILEATVSAADRYGVPVTMKTRMGIDDGHLTYLDAGRIAQEAGCAAIALHGRTVRQAYSGRADWDSIARLVDAVEIPVLGNGDIWEAADAAAMLQQTGAAGVVVGRGCLGRPWLFRDLAATVTGSGQTALPSLGEVAATVRRHGELLAELMGEERGLTDLRKHMAWYFKGFPVGGDGRRQLAMISSLAELDAQLERLDPSVPFPESELGQSRGRQGRERSKIAMPQGWLDDTDGCGTDLSEAEIGVSGG